MTKLMLSRRFVMLGAVSLPGCTALTSLNEAAQTLDTYDLSPASVVRSGNGTGPTLLVLEPSATAVVATDRILVKPNPQAVAYLPDARWADAVPAMLQSLLIRTLSATGRAGFVGAVGSGPVPDTVLLTRIDQFEVVVTGAAAFNVVVSLELTLLRDVDQRIVGSGEFRHVATVSDDRAPTIVTGFQEAMDAILPVASNWVGDRLVR